MDEHRFIALWMRAGSTQGESKARRVYRAVAEHYSETHRRYHSADHIRHCLRHVDLIPNDYPHKVAVELAIWFHDVIYRISDPDNERNSADWFATQAHDDLPQGLIKQVYEMIIATEHRDVPGTPESAYVVDIDLSSFGLPYDEFIADSRLVRAESTHLSDSEFYRGQREFLRNLLKRERIYVTDLFHDLFEKRARENIRITLDTIESV